MASIPLNSFASLRGFDILEGVFKTTDTMQVQFKESELKKIVEAATIYQCACPAQVAELLLELRRVESYESNCLKTAGNHLEATHINIRDAVTEVHERLERCLSEVLDIEGWDRCTLEMPESLRSKK